VEIFVETSALSTGSETFKFWHRVYVGDVLAVDEALASSSLWLRSTDTQTEYDYHTILYHIQVTVAVIDHESCPSGLRCSGPSSLLELDRGFSLLVFNSRLGGL